MKKNNHEEIEGIDLDSTYEKISIFIEKHAKNILYITLILISLILLSQWYFGSKTSGDLRSYHAAELSFAQLMKDPMNAVVYDKLMQLMVSHPALKSKYQARLIQLDIAKDGNVKEAGDLFNRISRTIPEVNKNFVQTTLLLSKGDRNPALQSALALEQELSKNNTQPLLRGYNLLRLAFLQQMHGNAEESKKSWDLYTRQIGEKERAQLASIFQLGSLNLEAFFNRAL